ncbi:aquaporin-1a.2 [Aplochiton taeniatus]
MGELGSWVFWRAVLAEFIGMVLFIVFGISSAIGNKNNADQEVKVALAFGLAIATLAQSLGHISGAHLNPAISLGLLVSCQISFLRCLLYVLAQMLGAVTASAIVYAVKPSSNAGLGVNKLNQISEVQGFGIEFFATLQLVLCVLAVTDKRRSDVTGSAPLAIGLSVGLGHLAAISFTGCGINPARTFGPALIMASFDSQWVYWLGPLLGGIAAALIYDFLLYPRRDEFSKRRNVLMTGSEPESAASGLIQRGSSSPGPAPWPRE